MLLFPLALEPTITVNGPARNVSSAKFLKSLSQSDVIIVRFRPRTGRVSRGVRHMHDPVCQIGMAAHPVVEADIRRHHRVLRLDR